MVIDNIPKQGKKSMSDPQPNWAEINAPWWQSYALWLERGEIKPPFGAKASIEDRQLIVARLRELASVRVDVVNHDWSAAYADGREMLGL